MPRPSRSSHSHSRSSDDPPPIGTCGEGASVGGVEPAFGVDGEDGVDGGDWGGGLGAGGGVEATVKGDPAL